MEELSENLEHILNLKPVEYSTFKISYVDYSDLIKETNALSSKKSVNNSFSKPLYNRDSYSETNTVNLSIKERMFSLAEYSVSTLINVDQINKLKDVGIYIDDYVKSALYKEMNLSICKKSLSLIRKWAIEKIEYNNLIEKTKKWFFNFFFKKLYIPSTKIDKNNYRKIINKIFSESNKIAKDTRIGPGNYIIVSQKFLIEVLETNKSFVHSQLKDISYNNTGLIYKVGTFCGLNVLVDTNQKWNSDEIIIGRKDNSNDDKGGLTFYYKPVTDISVVYSPINKDFKYFLNINCLITEVNPINKSCYRILKIKY